MKFNRKKSIALRISLFLILMLTVTGTIAFLITRDDPIKNTFQASYVTTDVTETFEDGKKTDVKIQNTGNTDAWIRAAVVVTWQNEDGNVYGQLPNAGTNYTQWIPGNDWIQGADGFYYYTKPVAAKQSTETALIDSIDPIGEAPAAGYYLTVEIVGSGIQNKPANVFDTEWADSGLKVQTKDSAGTELPPEQWILVNK